MITELDVCSEFKTVVKISLLFMTCTTAAVQESNWQYVKTDPILKQ